jgi:hypothetical protein|tara:strand:- start:594 stop:764 length:171 start_codon:yes stop_codon:yes gene_type:complete
MFTSFIQLYWQVSNAELTTDNLHKEGGLATLVRYVDHDHYSLEKLFFLDMIREIGE